MTRSIYDPSGDEMQRERGTFMPGEARNASRMPPDAIDGKFEEEPDAKVPLEGEAGDDTLTEADTEALADAAEDARADATNPDAGAQAPIPAKPGQEDAEDGSSWIGDV